MLLLLSCFIITGVPALCQSTTHYKKKDSSFCLQVQKSPPIEDVRWSFNSKYVVLKGKLSQDYTEKMRFNPNNYSLCINKLGETDSGYYKALIADSKWHDTSEIHLLIVQEPVPKPVIRMSLGSHGSNLSAGICELRVNCSVLGEWLLALCNQDSCRTSERFFSKVNITISAHNQSVVCSGQNHVSVHNASENMEGACYSESNTRPKETPLPLNEMVVVISVVLGVIIFALIACLAVRLCSAKYNRRQTSTAQLIQSQPAEPHPQPTTRDSTSSYSHPGASYENVDVTQTPVSSPTVNIQEELGSVESKTVDTVYSVLQLPRVNDSHGKSDKGSSTKDHEVIEVASASESGEAEHHKQVDSVYSMVQKPKT
ncbi:uncharacterized protein LOC141784379 [Halichoeres trimaculatus]|uniref:uncharacterized protein LOC141784379 n=1 Tax=Halichoeres trimaculatus TaxID=147232 RepID=UPI003D9E162E